MRSSWPLLLFFALSAIFFFAGQNPSVWKSTLGNFTGNYVHRDGQRVMADTAFTKIRPEGIRSWDGQHYLFIRDNAYNLEKAGGSYICAFFPAFPLLLGIIPVPDTWIPLLNIALFLAGIILLGRALNTDLSLFWAMATMPALVVFALPYTESLFFFALSLGIFGLLKERGGLVWIGFAVAAATRPSITILLLAAMGSAFVLAMRCREVKTPLSVLLRVMAPLLAGTLVAMIYQYFSGAGSLFAFFEAQSNWNHTFRMPETIADWSHEGFGMNIAAIILLVFPLLFLALPLLVFRLETWTTLPDFRSQWLDLCSIAYLIGAALFIVFFQGGSLNGTFRYVLCTPMFPVAVIALRKTLANFSPFISAAAFSFGILALLFLLDRLPYSGDWTFQDLGAILLAANLGLFLWGNKRNRLWGNAAKYILLGVNAVWTAYLFNVFLCDGWIYT